MIFLLYNNGYFYAVACALAVCLLMDARAVYGQDCAGPASCAAMLDDLTRGDGRLFWVDAIRGDDAGPGTADRPWATLARSVRPGTLAPGDAVVIRGGTYHEPLLPTASGAPGLPITFAGYPGETVVVSGATPFTPRWRRTGGDWLADWPYPPLWTKRIDDGVKQDDDARRRDVLIVDGAMLEPVYRRADLAPLRFFVEGSPHTPARVYLRLPPGQDPNALAVATSRLPHLFRTSQNDVSCLAGAHRSHLRLIGLTFEHAANEAQQGAVCVGGQGTTLERIVVRWTNGAGVLMSGTGQTLRGVTAEHNGMSGIRGERCDRCLVEQSASRYNNWKGYLPFWESGGGKWQFTTNSVFRGLDFSENEGPGLWLDRHNTGNVIEQSRFHGNLGVNLFLEMASDDNIVSNNVLTGARRARPSFFGYGILIHASDRNAVLFNTLMGNEGGGLRIRADHRGPAVGNRYYNNIFAAPRADAAFVWRELALENHRSLDEALTNRGDGNVFWPHAGATTDHQTFFIRLLGTSGADVLRTSSLRVWQSATGLDAASRIIEASALTDVSDRVDGWRLAEGSVLAGAAVPLPDELPAVRFDFDGDARPAGAASPGADEASMNGSLPGDASGDGTVSPYDAALVLGWVATPGSGTSRVNLDVNGDGRIDIADALAILRRALAVQPCREEDCYSSPLRDAHVIAIPSHAEQ